jgi:hypothetical protein
MKHVSIVCKIAFAIALGALALQHFVTGKVIAGRPPLWPTYLHGENLVAYVLATLLLLTSFSVLTGKLKFIVVATSAFIIFWAGFRNLYFVVTAGDTGFALTGMGKAFTLGSGMLLFFAFNIDASKGFAHVKTFLYSFCFLCTGLFFVASGIQHFLFVDFVKSLVPSWIPWSVFWTYFSGVALFTIGVCFICHLNVTAMALVAGTMVLVWTIIIHIPRAFETMDNQPRS